MSAVTANGLRIAYLDHGPAEPAAAGAAPALVLLPGLTANAHAFDGLVAAGLARGRRVLALDLRGRGGSDDAAGYDLADHAADVLGLLDALGLAQVDLGGHSFGGLLGWYLAAAAPGRFRRLAALDAAVALATPATRAAIAPSLARLGQSAPSWEAYLAAMGAAPYFAGWWDPLVESYYRADVIGLPGGAVRPRPRPEAMAAVMDAVVAADWPAIVAAVRQPCLLIHAAGNYVAAPILAPELALETAALLPDARTLLVPGNHVTMLYAEGAAATVAAIDAFLGARA